MLSQVWAWKEAGGQREEALSHLYPTLCPPDCVCPEGGGAAHSGVRGWENEVPAALESGHHPWMGTESHNLNCS